MNENETTSCGCTGDVKAGAANVTSSGLTTDIFLIENMDCPTEEALIRDKLGKLDGIHQLDFNLVQRKLTVAHSLPGPSPVESALAAIGMKANLTNSGGQTTTIFKIAK